jgi:ABC-type branched-subunit amino acid transport system substrate-binding protein
VTSLLVLVTGCGTRLPDSAFSPRASTAPPGGEIRVGMVDTVSGPLGPGVFDGPMYGAQAYFKDLNAHGGVDGRKITVFGCDDGGAGPGNVDCVHKLIDQDRVLAFAGTSVYDYAGARYVDQKGVPDVGGQPIGNAYDQWRTLFSIYGSDEPRDGKVGWDGKLYAGTEVYRYFKQKVGAHEAAVVYYNQASSIAYAQSIVAGLQAEGYGVVKEEADLALPNYGAAVADMKAHRVDIVFDALDTSGNGALCQAMDAAKLSVLAKVTTVQSWNSGVGADFAKSARCRNELWATSSDRNYEDTQIPEVAAFRNAVRAYAPGRPLSMWMLEGYVSAMWLTDALRSCRGTPSRACVLSFMQSGRPYDAHGLIIPAAFHSLPKPPATSTNCLNVARWQDSADGGRGGWVTQVPDMRTNCFTVPELPYSPG